MVDGRGLKQQGYEDGNFIGGTLFDHVTPSMRIYREEIFGPVLGIVRASDFDSVLTLVNAHEFGNGAAVFKRDGDSARLRAGRAGGNGGRERSHSVPMAFHFFGGRRASLFGEHHMHGPEGERFFTKFRTLTQRWPTGVRAGADFVLPTLG